MLVQIAIGSALLCVSIVISAYAAWGLELFIAARTAWLVPNRRRPRFVLMLIGVSFYVLAVLTAGVWMWGAVLWKIGAFPTFEESLYFAMVCFTTLGLGDVILPQEWRLLSGLVAANGLLNFGMMTALLIEALRHVRFAHGQRTAQDHSR